MSRHRRSEENEVDKEVLVFPGRERVEQQPHSLLGPTVNSVYLSKFVPLRSKSLTRNIFLKVTPSSSD